MADSEPAAPGMVAAQLLVGDVTEKVRPNAKLIGLLALGHFMVDVNQGSLPAILPFLKTAHQLSYAEAGAIVLAAHITSSIVQPLFGYFADVMARRWLLPLAVFVSGVGLGLTGVAPGYGSLLVLIVVMGLGIAAYHPEGYRTAASVAGDRKATALSWFSLGGNVGIALGPPLITMLVTGLGLVGSLGMLVPSAIVTALILGGLPALARAAAPAPQQAKAAVSGVNMRWAMGLLILVVTIRSWSQLGFTTYVPFYYVDVLRADPRVVGPLLFLYLGAGAVGTVIAGPIADRWGPRVFITRVLIAAAPLGVLFLATSGVLAIVALALFGAVLVSSFTIAIVLGQAYLPRNAGIASGLIVGFAIGAGGLGVTMLGWVADHYGLLTALWISALLPLVGFLIALALPSPRDRSTMVA